MKKWIAIVLLALSATDADAQSNWFKEWFRQKETQREYLALQIVGLQAYIGVARKGYDIAQKGLTTIGHIKDGDFNLHRDFFGSLKGVNPAIKHSSKVADIIAMQQDILNTYRQDFSGLRASGMLDRRETDYLSKVYGRLLDDCGSIIDELLQLTMDGQVEMSDDERLQRIETLYNQMRESRAFCRAFGGEAKMLAASRQRERMETINSRAWNGLK